MIKKRLCSSLSPSLIAGLVSNHQRCCSCSMAANSSLTLVRNSYRDAFEWDNSNGFQSFALKYKPFSRTVCVKSRGDKINDNGSDKFLFKGRRPRALSPSLSQLIGGDFGKKSNGVVDQVFDKSRGCHTIGFPDPPLLQKLVVAVDIDEGIYLFTIKMSLFEFYNASMWLNSAFDVYMLFV